ncbi:MAG: peptidoglycan-associated lipoprotein, partial [Gemmatimonadota bacterium]
PDRLTTISYGEERPFAEGHNEAAWQQNRRDEFIPIP